MEVSFCDIYRLENGEIIRADSYFDFYRLLRQLASERAQGVFMISGPSISLRKRFKPQKL